MSICGHFSSSIHSNYERSFQDLQISDKKVVVILKNRKFFCQNPCCKKTTFAECFDFIVSKAKKTNRLEEGIVSLALNCSSIAASVQLKRNVVNVGKSTICELLKKKGNQTFIRRAFQQSELMILLSKSSSLTEL